MYEWREHGKRTKQVKMERSPLGGPNGGAQTAVNGIAGIYWLWCGRFQMHTAPSISPIYTTTSFMVETVFSAKLFVVYL